MIPLTNCLLAFTRDDEQQTRRAPLVLVDGQLLDAGRVATG